MLRDTMQCELYAAWKATADLRAEVAELRARKACAKRNNLLTAVIASQEPALDSALSVAEVSEPHLLQLLQAIECSAVRVPLAHGTQADAHEVKEALDELHSALGAVGPSVTSLLPKVEEAVSLSSQLLELVGQEEDLLRKIKPLLDKHAALEIEERSLRAHLLQVEREKLRMPPWGFDPLSTRC
eukprot:SM000003S11023  [mRNA]  locus=s3:476043:477310:+ [translate_table: standard]